jgi:hypothetical protein
VIYFPSTTTITMPNNGQTATSCQQFGGYHSHVVLDKAGGGTVDTAYAIVPQCTNPLLGIKTSVSASHEIIEAATDPLVTDQQANGYYMDQTRDAWTSISAAEVGDVCALLKDFATNPFASPSADEATEGSFTVQRSFSNKSLLANNDPCVPAPAGVYFNVAPETETLKMNTGDTKTVTLTGFSNGPTADWDVKTLDFTALTNPFGGGGVLSLSLDKAKANNGTTLQLTVKVTGTVDAQTGASFVIISTSGNKVSFWPMIVHTP